MEGVDIIGIMRRAAPETPSVAGLPFAVLSGGAAPAWPEPEAAEGWHVNTTPQVLAARPELEPFVITPATLRRVWAGDDPANPARTVALRFADEAEAASFFPAD